MQLCASVFCGVEHKVMNSPHTPWRCKRDLSF